MSATILVIDDDVQICHLLKDFLRQQDYEVVVAGNGEEGVKIALELMPDLIICDLDMPKLDGQGVISTLRQDPRLGEVAFIFLSACTKRDQIRMSINLGGDDFITKPAQLPEILEAVKARLGRQQKLQGKINQQFEQAAQIFVGIINDLKPDGAKTRWLTDSLAETAGQKNQIIRHIQKSLAAGTANAGKPGAGLPPDSLLLKDSNREEFLKLSEVKALTAYGEYSNIRWGKEQHFLFRKTLKQWEAELPPEQFVRVHRQAIINLAFIDFVEKNPAGKRMIHLRDFKEIIPVSRRESPNFNRCMKLFKSVKPQRPKAVRSPV